MPRSIRSHGWLIPSLGLTQIVGYGSMFYAYGVLMEPMQAGLGLSKPVIVGAYSVALLLSGLFSTIAGSIIDRIGGRLVMGCGSVLAALMFVWLSRVESVASLYLAWAGIGVAMSGTLYQPAFAVLTQVFRNDYRHAITHLTLYGGFASSVFWPLTQFLLQYLDWRDIWLAYAALNLLICLPVHAALPKGGERVRDAPTARSDNGQAGLRTVLREPVFYLVTSAFTFNALVFSGMSLHLMAILQDRGMSLAHAAWVGAMVGPMQVLGRVLETTFGRRASSRVIGMLAISFLPLSLVLLFAPADWLFAYVVFAALYGMGNGVMTIVRGVFPAEMYGRSAYGAISGAMATPVQVAIAAGPFVASLLHALAGGYPGTIMALCAIGAAGAGLFLYAATHLRRSRPAFGGEGGA